MRTYSYSKLETYKLCPLKYKFRYIDEIPVEVEGVEAFVGSRVHEVLQKLYKDLFREKINSLEELLAFYRSAWRKQWGKHVRIHDEGFSQDHYLEYGARCIQNYYEAFKPFNQTPTLGTEIHLQFSLDPEGRYKISGFIDRVARRADGTFEIHDYKTGRSLPSQEKLDNDRQLGLYEIGLKAYWPDVKQVELLWHYVGFLQTFRSQRAPEQLRILREETIGLIGRIECQKQFDPAKGAWCDWCEYRALCPLWKHMETVGVLPPAEFAADEGVKLATEYARTKSEVDRLQGQLEALRESIIEFARQKQVQVLEGEGARVGVKIQEKTRFPAKEDPLREQLESFLKSAGLWEEVSSLNLTELSKVLDEMKWPPNLLERLRNFATTEECITVRVAQTEKEKEPAESS